MTLGGIKDLIPFLKFLRDQNAWFRIESVRDDAVTIELPFPGMRIEVDVFDDHIEYSSFTGDESVEDDPKKLIDLIVKLRS